MSNYDRGAKFERRVQDFYEEQNMDAVRSAGSKGPSDVTAFFRGRIIFNTLRIGNYWSPEEREAFEMLIERHPSSMGRYVWRGSKKERYKIYFKEA